MAKQREKEIAQQLRKEGRSINEIAERLTVSKSTVSFWCKDISLTSKQIETLALRSKHHATEALLRAAERQRLQRAADIKEMTETGIATVGKLTKRDMYMVGLGLYWGEGYKQGSQELGFTNSNPNIILFYLQWLEKIYEIQKRDLILRVSINELHAERIDAVQKYWSVLTGIPNQQFTKPSLIKTRSKKIYTNMEHHFGTLRVKVRRGTNLRRRILGSIQALRTK